MKDMKQQNTVNLGNIYLSNQCNLRNLRLENDQSKQLNYAKRTQFQICQNETNLLFYKGL